MRSEVFTDEKIDCVLRVYDVACVFTKDSKGPYGCILWIEMKMEEGNNIRDYTAS
jgi:hypothetical protein